MGLAVVAHTFYPSTPEVEAGRFEFSEFEANLVHRASSRTARDTHRNSVSKSQNEQSRKE